MTVLQPLTQLKWQSRYVNRLPGDPESRNFTRQVRGAFYSQVTPTPVKNPVLMAWSEDLAQNLGISRPDDQESMELLAGNRILKEMKPYAARYGGHQFGNWADQLGDGRAITLGEITSPHGLFELQLKGAGPTPYSRRADGRAVLRSSVREFLCSEAMHFLGVPTTRALSLVATGDDVVRDLFYDGNPRAEPGAIVCRVSPTFLRFGNFEILTANGEPENLKILVDLLLEEHFQELNPQNPDVYGLLLDEVARRTARMITHWMRVGFVHGVMNTDNMSILGLTIDYGPYGWLEPYEPGWTPNTTDAQGRRYCFGNQPGIAQWNLARLCEAFLPLIPDKQRLHQTLEIYQQTFQEAYTEMLAAKMGVASIQGGEDQPLLDEMFTLLQKTETDYTIFFRAISNWSNWDDSNAPTSQNSSVNHFLKLITPAFYQPAVLNPSDSGDSNLREAWIQWSRKYAVRIAQDHLDPIARMSQMKNVNPKYVLRNYLAQNAIIAAETGDLTVLNRLMRVLKTPYDELPADAELAEKRPEWARNSPGCSALSCSS